MDELKKYLVESYEEISKAPSDGDQDYYWGYSAALIRVANAIDFDLIEAVTDGRMTMYKPKEVISNE